MLPPGGMRDEGKTMGNPGRRGPGGAAADGHHAFGPGAGGGVATAGVANPRAVRRSVGAKGAGSARLQREADHVFYGHAVTRRIAAPEEILHADFRAAQAYYGEAWQLLSFSADALEMSREIDLFCPMHRVIGCNEAGEIVRSRNVYGDGTAIEKTTPCCWNRCSRGSRTRCAWAWALTRRRRPTPGPPRIDRSGKRKYNSPCRKSGREDTRS